ncbi:hypothetical protein SETIT_5G436700v2 [Setaria italica]|uniref:Uncharacterized protein n=1 Tax=Setaria italica TaxID=4555 RepID=A0A368RFM3_SETIT|nr:hypothetical protein SETIT_5G436700v2 [Setaria italica]
MFSMGLFGLQYFRLLWAQFHRPAISSAPAPAPADRRKVVGPACACCIGRGKSEMSRSKLDA